MSDQDVSSGWHADSSFEDWSGLAERMSHKLGPVAVSDQVKRLAAFDVEPQQFAADVQLFERMMDAAADTDVERPALLERTLSTAAILGFACNVRALPRVAFSSQLSSLLTRLLTVLPRAARDAPAARGMVVRLTRRGPLTPRAPAGFGASVSGSIPASLAA